MELFTVTRYSESGAVESEAKPENEDKLLKKLLRKAKKRKLEELEINSLEIEIPKETEAEPVKELDQIENNVEKDKDHGENKGFQMLGDDTFQKRQKVEMILPSWLAYPSIISTKLLQDESESVDNLKYLSPIIKENLNQMGILKLFPVQKDVIPSILNAHSKPFPFKPRDVCVSAPTGSGKTLAFGIPLIQLLMNRVECKVRALIILPVNELALQVFKVLKSLANGTALSICLFSKNIPFAKEQQKVVDFFKGQYYSKADIIVTTPGRLVEHLHSTKGFCLKNLKFLVIDEADRIMEQIHFNWLYHLDEHVRKTSDEIFSGSTASLCLQELIGTLANQPHKMLFSATLSHDPEKLINLKLFQPKLFTTIPVRIEELTEKSIENKNGTNSMKEGAQNEFIGKYTTPSELIEKICLTQIQTKPLTLFALMKENNWNKFLCFTNSIDSAHRLTKVLNFFFENKNVICELSASLPAKKRIEILDNFTRGRIRGLICSDALARGIDIPEVDIVISYDVPRHIKTYIHRVGRTARAGRPGTSILLSTEEEFKKFKNILLDVGKTITEEIKVNGRLEEEYAKKYTKALHNLQKELEHNKNLELVKKNIFKYGTNNNNNNVSTKMSALENLQNQFTATIQAKLGETNEIPIQRKFRKKKKAEKTGVKIKK